jgi:hypothetical protein
MHQTTVRFGPDLWEALEAECGRLGMSAAQYVREAALARLSYTAGVRGETDYGIALVSAGAAPEVQELPDEAQDAPIEASIAQSSSAEQMLAAAAVSAQSDVVLRRAQEVRAQSVELRRQRREVGR